MKKNITRYTSRIVSILLLVFSVFALFQSTKLKFGTFSAPKNGFVPTVVSSLMVLLCIVDVIMEFIKKPTVPDDLKNIEWLKFLAFSLLCFVYVFLLKRIGFLVDTIIILFLMIKVAGIKGWIKVALISIIFSLFLWYAFTTLLHVPLPTAEWF